MTTVSKEKTPRDSLYLTRRIVGPSDLNPHGTLFGGMMMSWMDEVAYCAARKHAGVPTCVTVNIDNIVFLHSVQLGETVVLSAQVNHVGKSSMEIGVRVEKEDPFTGDRTHTNSAYLTFVAVDKKGIPIEVPRLKLETQDDLRRSEEARIRIKVRNRVKAAMKRKLGHLEGSTKNLSEPLEVAKVQVRALKLIDRIERAQKNLIDGFKQGILKSLHSVNSTK